MFGSAPLVNEVIPSEQVTYSKSCPILEKLLLASLASFNLPCESLFNLTLAALCFLVLCTSRCVCRS